MKKNKRLSETVKVSWISEMKSERGPALSDR
jgi:hypothetical protein